MIARVHGDATLAQRFAAELTQLPTVQLIALDSILAQQALELAAANKLRGADAVYAAVAQRFAAVLITRDREQNDRLAGAVTVRTPEEELQQLSS